MAPASKPNSSPLESDMRFILSAIASCPDFSPVWKIVANENSISHDRNASTKFRNTVKKYGYKLDDGKLMRLPGSQDQQEGAQAAPETPRKAVKSKTPDSSAKKRKVDGEEGMAKKMKPDIGEHEGDDQNWRIL